MADRLRPFTADEPRSLWFSPPAAMRHAAVR
jgi:hypothetical protein